jgi:hypothetical protein
VTFSKQAKEVDAEQGATLPVQHLVLISVDYRHGKFGGIGIETLDERLPLLRRRGAERACVVGEDVGGGARCRCHAMAFPVQLPEPSPSGEGAGWAIGVALP